MQDKSKKQNKGSGNMLTQINSLFARLSTGKKDFLKVAYFRNPNSLLDEFLIGMLALMGVTILIIAGLGIYYHFTIFSGAFRFAWIGIGGSLLLFIVAEVLNVWFGLNLFRTIYSGNFFKSIQHFLVTAGIAVFVLFAFRWSLHISTKAVSQLNENLSKEKMLQEHLFNPEQSTSDIDAQIAAAEKRIEDHRKNKNSQGVIFWSSTQAIEQESKTIANLTEQRALILQQDKSTYDSTLIAKNLIILNTSAQLAEYGGYAEWLRLFIIMLLPLLEDIAYRRNKKDQEAIPAESNYEEISGAQDIEEDEKAMWNSRPRIGFQHTANSAKTTPPPPDVSRKLKTAETIVAQETQPVSQQPKQVKETVIVTAPQEDVSKWKKYASIYYKRSHTSATMDTRNNNWERYQEYKELLINAGISIEEGETLTFK